MSRHPDPLSSHVLDTSLGSPAKDITITLFRQVQSEKIEWQKISSKSTNSDGRASAFLSWPEFSTGIYKLHFDIQSYFEKLGKKSFYPFAEVVFEIEENTEHYHVPLLLSPYSYTTYRGS